MRAPSITVDVSLDEFEDDDIAKYLKGRGYKVFENTPPPEFPSLKTKEFSYQNEKIMEQLEALLSRHNPWKVLAYLEDAKL